MRKWVLGMLMALGAISCDSNVVVTEYRSVQGGVWDRDLPVTFEFSGMDTISPHQLYIQLRNDATYPFSNIFLIANLTTPKGEVITDTLEYAMALPDGTWLGKGMGSVKENKLWLKENIVFHDSGVYILEIQHAMRKNGNVVGMEGLPGITDVGVEVSKSNP